MIDKKRWRDFVLRIAPELSAHPVYIVDCDTGRIDDFCLGCLASTLQPTASYAVAGKIQNWRGAGTVFLLRSTIIRHQAEAKRITFDNLLAAIFVHETAHAVPIGSPLLKVEGRPDAKTMKLVRDFGLHLASEASTEPGGNDDMHGPGYVRRLLHCWVRSLHITGFDDMPLLCGPWFIGIDFAPYLLPLMPEIVRMRDRTFSEIESVDPPGEFLRAWQFDRISFLQRNKFNRAPDEICIA